jgi:hypothetical protein
VPSSNLLEFREGEGTADVGFGYGADESPVLAYEGGRFQACRVGEEVVVRFVSQGQRYLAGCAQAELLPKCVEEEGGEGHEVECVAI